jgi:phosphatidate cytidylyltransferase
MDLRKLLQNRETAALIIGAVTLLIILLPSPLFALAVAGLSYILAWEVERFTQTRFLSYFAPLVFLFSVDNPSVGIFLAFLISFGIAYFELKLTGIYKFHSLARFLTFLLYTGWLPVALFLVKKESSLLLLALILSVWANDSLAYYVGKHFGRKPFFKEISPKKTWEGFWGGVLGGTFVGTLIAVFLGLKAPIYVWFVVSIAAVFGDLFESFIKRSFGVKDSSTLLESHGGFLDRFDALLFAAFALTIFVS